MDNVIEQLKKPGVLATRSEVIGRNSKAPKVPGIYAWYFKSSPHQEIEFEHCHSHDGWRLLYVGISPSKPPANGKPPSKGTLKKRINTHMKGNASTSTLRLSIGCLLSESLGIQLRRVGRTQRFNFFEDEKVLSDWLENNVKVTWVAHNEPWTVEGKVIAALQPPLNLSGNPENPFYGTLADLRRAAREKAKKLEVLFK